MTDKEFDKIQVGHFIEDDEGFIYQVTEHDHTGAIAVCYDINRKKPKDCYFTRALVVKHWSPSEYIKHYAEKCYQARVKDLIYDSERYLEFELKSKYSDGYSQAIKHVLERLK